MLVLAEQSPEQIQQTLHELRVRQVELEMQTDELRRVQQDLYDLAPVGYCTVAETGLILEANLAAAGLLGLTRSALLVGGEPVVLARGDTGYVRAGRIHDAKYLEECRLVYVHDGPFGFRAH